jgi:hypothetical protein
LRTAHRTTILQRTLGETSEIEVARDPMLWRCLIDSDAIAERAAQPGHQRAGCDGRQQRLAGVTHIVHAGDIGFAERYRWTPTDSRAWRVGGAAAHP